MPFAVIVQFAAADDAEEFAGLLSDLLENMGGDPTAVMVAEELSREHMESQTLQ